MEVVCHHNSHVSRDRDVQTYGKRLDSEQVSCSSAVPPAEQLALGSGSSISFSRDPCDTEIRPEILRGIRVSRLLRSGGIVLRTSPVDLPPEELRPLYNKSEQCSKLDAFISQSWTSPGWQKYIALLVHWYGTFAAAAAVTSMLLFAVLDGPGFLPTLESASVDRVGWDSNQGTAQLSPWCLVPPCLGFVCLFWAPYAPWLPMHRVFFDAACIDQQNGETKLEGIYSLPGFVANSEKLIILWSQSYFHRAWCILELSVFVAAYGQRPIIFLPLFATTSVFTGYIMIFAWTCLFVAVDSLGLGGLHGELLFLARLVFSAVVAKFAHELRAQFVGIRYLTSELEHFDFETLQCREQSDMEFIRGCVEAFHGSKDNFNSFVQDTFKRTIIASQSNFDFRYLHCISMLFPGVCYASAQVLSFVRAGLTAEAAVSAFLGQAALVFSVQPICVRILFMLCRRFPKEGRGFLANVAISIGIALAVVILLFLCIAGCIAITNNVPFGGVLTFVCAGIASCVIFHS